MPPVPVVHLSPGLVKSKAIYLRYVKHFIIDECGEVLESLGKIKFNLKKKI